MRAQIKLGRKSECVSMTTADFTPCSLYARVHTELCKAGQGLKCVAISTRLGSPTVAEKDLKLGTKQEYKEMNTFLVCLVKSVTECLQKHPQD